MKKKEKKYDNNRLRSREEKMAEIKGKHNKKQTKNRE